VAAPGYSSFEVEQEATTHNTSNVARRPAIDQNDMIGDLEIVCLRLDYGDFAVDGGMVLRSWREGGLRVWGIPHRPFELCRDRARGDYDTSRGLTFAVGRRPVGLLDT
jgi:hypothetical protein